MRLPPRGPLRQMAQFHAQDRGLQFVEAAVPSAFGAEVLARLAVIAQRAQRAASFSSLVTIIPASPYAPRFLLG